MKVASYGTAYAHKFAPSLLFKDACMSHHKLYPPDWVVVKELNSNYHDGYIYIYKLTWFPRYRNLNEVP